MGSCRRRVLGLLVCLLGAGAWPAAAAAAPGTTAVAQLTGLAPSQLASAQACPPPIRGSATCFAQVIVRAGTHRPVHVPRPTHAHPVVTTTAIATPATATQATEPAGSSAPLAGTAAYLQRAYDLSWLAQNRGSADTVAIVDAYADPSIAGDLATFRSADGLSACTTASGCLTIVNENGGTTPPSTSDGGWDTEQTLDVDAVSALCPNCHLLLIEANSNAWSDLHTAVRTADALGAQQISMSFGAEGAPLSGAWAFPGVASLAAGGDYGYQGDGNDTVPATNPGVTAVGGTSLAVSHATRGFAETAWSLQSNGSGTGSGCDLYEAKPSWQTDTGCTGRAWNDVSADADPSSGLNIYDTGDGGWEFVGGTSLATPLTAAYEAVTAVDGTSPQWAYTDTSLLNDIVSGSSGTCTTEPAYICDAAPGYDGPTGNGSISGDVATGAPGIGGSRVQRTEPGTAELAGGVYPNGLDTTYWWEYGATNSYGQQTTAQDIGAGAGLVALQDVAGGLTPGTTYHVRLVAENADGTAYGPDTTLTTLAGIPADPVNLTAPSVAGAPEQGETLTADPGTWSASTSLSYRWQEAGSAAGPFIDITGASADRYTPSAGDLGQYLRVVVIDDAAGAGLTEATSAAVGPVVIPPPTATTAPSITGTATEGQVLTSDAGAWTFPGTVSYAWQRSDSGAWDDISGATTATYTLTGDDVGSQVRLVVTETNSTGGTSAASASVGPVAGLAPPQVTTSSTTTSAPTPTPAPAPTPSPPASTTPTAAPSPPASAPSSPVTTTPPPGVVAAPSLHGRATVGARISIAPGRYRDTSRQSVRYYRCTPHCRPVGRAGESTYRLGAADAGAYIRARVTLWGAGGERAFWVPGLLGPVTSADAGVAGLRLGHRALLRARRSRPLARAKASGATAASRGISGRIRISFARARARGGTVKVWACVLRGRELIACTRRRALRRRLTVTVPLVNGERVQVIALRRA